MDIVTFVSSDPKLKILAGNQVAPALRVDEQSGLVVNFNGELAEAARTGQMCFAVNTAAQAVSAALATTYTGLVVENPAGSQFKGYLRLASYALSVAPAAIAPIFLGRGFLAAGALSAQTVGSSAKYKGDLSNLDAPKLNAYASATVSASAGFAYGIPLMGGFTAAALPSSPLALADLKGGLLIMPGSFVCIVALTAVTGFGLLGWTEEPL